MNLIKKNSYLYKLREKAINLVKEFDMDRLMIQRERDGSLIEVWRTNELEKRQKTE